MSDQIDREAVERMLVEMLLNNLLPELVDELRSLPAAVPVVDVEKGNREVVRQNAMLAAALNRPGGGEYEWDTKAILSAGYVGAVSVEDVRRVAQAIENDADAFAPITAEAAKRLLAAISNDKGESK